MIVTRTVLALGLLGYLALWGLAASGATGLLPILITPLALVVLIGGGAWLTRYLGLPTRGPKFEQPDDTQ